MEKDYKALRAELIKANGIKLTTVFIPFSKSRNANEKHKSLNWKVTLWRNDTAIITTDYSAGCGHCPAYKKPPRFGNGNPDKWAQEQLIAFECEKGIAGFSVSPNFGSVMPRSGNKKIEPDLESVLYSLIMDGDALDYRGFEDWAENFGYDPDSREAEKTYKACMDIALQMRNGLGEKLLSELKEAFTDY